VLALCIFESGSGLGLAAARFTRQRLKHARELVMTLQGVTAASSGTHTHAGGKSRRIAWRCLACPSAGCGGYWRGAAEIPAGSL